MCQELRLELAQSKGVCKARIGWGMKWLPNCKSWGVGMERDFETTRLQLVAFGRYCFENV